MAELEAGSAEYSWAKSVIDAVARRGRREVRWNGKVMIGNRPESRLRTETSFVSATDSVWLTHENLAGVRQALEPAEAGQRSEAELNARHVALLDATGDLATQAVCLTGPREDRPGMTAHAEAVLHRGLGKTLVQEDMAGLWRDSDSSRLIPIESVPNPHFAYQSDVGASVTRDAIRELVRQQDGRLAGPDDYLRTTDALLQVAPDRRWEAMAKLIPGADRLDELDLRDVAAQSFRGDFQRAVQAGNPGRGTTTSSATTAVRELAYNIEERPDAGSGLVSGPQAIGSPHDPALTSPGLMTNAENNIPAVNSQRTGWADQSRGEQRPSSGRGE